ncbi:MAG TPA: GNAT family N-acetyltransferase [Lacunisphaera sp.]|nr:GNAT family N-acetyltransferase [Lacunisphaera sp.]
MAPACEIQRGDYLLSDDPARLQVEAIHAYLTTSYWAAGIPRGTVERALANSLCIGAYLANRTQVGLARFVTDSATFCYVCDVYVVEEHRRKGIAPAMLALAVRHPRLQGLRRWNLVTADAHGLYAPFGFKVPAAPERYMERLDPDVYRRMAGTGQLPGTSESPGR